MNTPNSYKMDSSDEGPFLSVSQSDTHTYVHKHEPTAEEKKLTKLLIERVLPPFSKSLRLQALVVYQADQEKMKCLLVNQTYEKTNGHFSENDSSNHDLSDSGLMDTSTESNSPVKTEVHDASKKYSFSIPRRKRKLSRPCKIPQSSVVLDPTEALPTTTITSPNPTVVAAPQISKPVTETISPMKSGATNGLFLPVSAVTLLPHVSVFSLPVTVLSTVHRPILPRICTDKQPLIRSVNNYNLQAVISPQLKHTTSSNSPSKTLTKESPNSTEDSSVLNRRYAKSFICNQCRKPFTSLNLLCEHTFAVHKAFRCTICGAQFTQRSNLQRHSLRHVGFKPFVCKICDKSYYRKDHLVRHIELTHPGCDPRTNLTVKLSSAECLDYLDQINKQDITNIEHMQISCQNTSSNNASEISTKQDEKDSKDKVCIIAPQQLEQLNMCSPSHQISTSINS
ncbi:Zinc finger protein 510 [Schistosoma japonicum]|nr:Zinc finger protein 510 [Schistosoma japonicum]KAH8859555.1 Zinc finger protein 510 [Schistosoma japonicum]